MGSCVQDTNITWESPVSLAVLWGRSLGQRPPPQDLGTQGNVNPPGDVTPAVSGTPADVSLPSEASPAVGTAPWSLPPRVQGTPAPGHPGREGEATLGGDTEQGGQSRRASSR
jgi:hypothetical protein